MIKKYINRFSKGLLMMAGLAMVFSGGGISLVSAATANNPASFTLGPGPGNPATSGVATKEDIGNAEPEYGHARASYVYNVSNGVFYFRVRNAGDSDHVSKLSSQTVNSGTNASNKNFTMKYERGKNVDNGSTLRLRALLKNATKGYASTSGTWYP